MAETCVAFWPSCFDNRTWLGEAHFDWEALMFAKAMQLTMVGMLLVRVSSQAAVLQWEETGGPTGTAVTALLAEGSGQVLAGGEAGLVHLSPDQGHSWSLQADLPSYDVHDLVRTPDGALLAAAFTTGMFRSTDNGLSWQPSNTGLASTYLEDLLVLPNGELLVATTDNYIFRSADDGLTWSPSGSGITLIHVWGLAQAPGGSIFAGTFGNGIFRSTDNGHTWVPSGNSHPTIQSLAAAPDGSIFAGTFSGGVQRSTDNGLSWQTVNTGIATGWIRKVFCASDGRVCAAGDSLYISLDGGDSWQAARGAGAPVGVQCFAQAANGEILAGTARLGVARIPGHPNSWLSGSDLANARVQAMALANGTLWAACQNIGLARSENGGASWTRVPLATLAQNFPAMVAHPDGTLLVGSTGSGIFRSTDDGHSWLTSNTGLTGLNVDALALGAGGSILASVRDEGFFRSEDGGLSWGQHNSGLRDRRVRALAASPDGTVYASTLNGLFISTDNGSHWDEAGLDDLPSLSTYGLFSDTPGEALVSVPGHGLWRTTDGGTTWQADNSGLESGTTGCLWRDSDGALLAAALGGVWRQATPGEAWQPHSTGLNGLMATAFAGDGEHIWVGTAQGGVYEGLSVAPSCQAPANVLVEIQGHVALLSWDAVPGAQAYSIWKSASGFGPWELAGSTGIPQYQDPSAGDAAYYQVRSVCP